MQETSKKQPSSRKRKTKTIKEEQQVTKVKKGGRPQHKLNQLSLHNGQLKIVLQSHKKADYDRLQSELEIVLCQFTQIDNFILINALNMNAQSKNNFQKYLEKIKTINLKKFTYFLTSIQAIDIIFRNIIYIPLVLNTNCIQELTIYINPKQFEHSLYVKKTHLTPSQSYAFPKLKCFSLSLSERQLEEKDYQFAEILLNSINAAQKLESLQLNLSSTYFENENLLEKIIHKALGQFKRLKNLSLDFSNILKINKINCLPINSVSLQIFQINLRMISINQKFMISLMKILVSQKELKFLDINFSKTNMDIRKLRELINSIVQLDNLETLILDLSGNIFCQSFKNKIFDEEQEIVKKELKQFVLKFNSTSCLSDEHTTLSPDFFILLKFNFRKLILDLSDTIQTYSSLDILGQELIQTHCSDLKIQLNNTRIFYEQIIFLSKNLHNCRNILRLQLELKQNMFLDSQINLIVASFIQTKFMHLNIIFDQETKSRLINDYAINNIFLIKSNLVNQKYERILFMKRLYLKLLMKLEKMNIEPFLNQFIIDIF